MFSEPLLFRDGDAGHGERELRLSALLAELRIYDEQPVSVSGGGRRVLERRTAEAFTGFAAREVFGQLYRNHVARLIADDVEVLSVEYEAVAGGEGGASQIYLCDLFSLGVYAKEVAGVVLDRDQIPSIFRRHNAVQVESVPILDRRTLEVYVLLERQVFAATRHPVQNRGERVGEVGFSVRSRDGFS